MPRMRSGRNARVIKSLPNLEDSRLQLPFHSPVYVAPFSKVCESLAAVVWQTCYGKPDSVLAISQRARQGAVLQLCMFAVWQKKETLAISLCMCTWHMVPSGEKQQTKYAYVLVHPWF